MSDGEGLERVWAVLACIIACLRYVTKIHRLNALELKVDHMNETLLNNAG